MEKNTLEIKMNEIYKFLEIEPFSLDKKEKNLEFIKILNKIVSHHYNNSERYKKILDFLAIV